MKKRAVRLHEVSVTRVTIQLSPRATAGMAVGAEVAQPQPASIVTARMRTEGHHGVDGLWASVGRRHRIGSPRRWHLSMGGVVFTRGAMRSLRKTLEGFGFVG